jgi:hypothetical protein
VAVDSPHRVWTAVISVPGYSPTSATWSEHDQHDDQILHAAHEAVRLMRKSGAQFGVIDLFQNTEENGNQHVEQRTISFDERGMVISANRVAR